MGNPKGSESQSESLTDCVSILSQQIDTIVGGYITLSSDSKTIKEIIIGVVDDVKSIINAYDAYVGD